MKRQSSLLTIGAFLVLFIVTYFGGGNVKDLLPLGQKSSVESYLENMAAAVSENTHIKEIQFQAIGGENSGGIKDVILTYNGNYDNNTIGKKILEYSKVYFKAISKDTSIRDLKGISLKFHLQGVDEKGQNARSVLSITIEVNRMAELNWDNLSLEDLKKVADCHLDPAKNE